MVQGRFSGDNDAPGYSEGSDVAKHSTVRVIFSTNSARWVWSNTAHGPFKATGQITTDIRTVAIHEVGHAAGLAHPYACDGTYTTAEQAGVMTAQWNAPRRALAADDINGLNAIGY